MRLIDLDEFLRQNCVDRMEGKSCEECKHHVLEVSCERLMEQPTIDPVKRGRWSREHLPSTSGGTYEVWRCSECQSAFNWRMRYCGHCGARMAEGEEG